MGKNRHFTEEEKSEMLAMYIELNSFSAVGERLGITRQSVKQVIDRALAVPEIRAEYETKKKSFADRFEIKTEYLIDKVLDALEKEIIEVLESKRGVKLNELTAVMTALYDKRALIRGESTDSTSIKILLPKEAEEYSQ